MREVDEHSRTASAALPPAPPAPAGPGSRAEGPSPAPRPPAHRGQRRADASALRSHGDEHGVAPRGGQQAGGRCGQDVPSRRRSNPFGVPIRRPAPAASTTPVTCTGPAQHTTTTTNGPQCSSSNSRRWTPPAARGPAHLLRRPRLGRARRRGATVRLRRDLLSTAATDLAATSEQDVDAALAAHPRIGERSESATSRREQAGALARRRGRPAPPRRGEPPVRGTLRTRLPRLRHGASARTNSWPCSRQRLGTTRRRNGRCCGRELAAITDLRCVASWVRTRDQPVHPRPRRRHGNPAAGIALEVTADGSPSRRVSPTPTAGARLAEDLAPGRTGCGSPRRLVRRAGRETFHPEVVVAFAVTPGVRTCTSPSCCPLRLLHLPRELRHGRRPGGHQYGKAENRVVRFQRDTPRHEIVDLNVTSTLRGDFADAYLSGDQRKVLPTDSQKNTIYAFAKEGPAGRAWRRGSSPSRRTRSTSPATSSTRPDPSREPASTWTPTAGNVPSSPAASTTTRGCGRAGGADRRRHRLRQRRDREVHVVAGG